ncbi:ABC transporter permease [Nocardioides sp. WS12]|uniref:ABC transporter permease n=1 Tax=Nocardioides sp. WS12 TaxID=2486272 RepID=UPI00191FEDF7|nr:ABC transporter permease [Nocardioides sp. WS12]
MSTDRTSAPGSDAPGTSLLRGAGSLVSFSVQAFKSVPTALRLYPSEVMRQVGLMIKSNAPVVFFMLFMLGALIGITGTFLFEGIGLESYVGSITAVPMMRGISQIVFGWVLAAKAGCGTVAELGAMRISEEIDGMEVMGVQSLPFLVGTRLMAAIVVVPPMFTIALGIHFAASKFFFVDALGAVSPGGYHYVLFLFQSPRDLTIAVLWATIVAVIVTLVSCYFGYTAEGGPVGVGHATAQSMLVNLMLISASATIIAQLFYAGLFNEAIGT